MDKENSIKLFEDRKIRSVWNEDEEEKLRKRDSLLGDYIGTNCPQIAMATETGKKVVSPLNARSIRSIEKGKKEK